MTVRVRYSDEPEGTWHTPAEFLSAPQPAAAELAALTPDELRTLATAVCDCAKNLYDAASQIMDQMAAIPAAQSYLPPYQRLKAKRDTVMAAARAQNARYAEIRDAISYREQI